MTVRLPLFLLLASGCSTPCADVTATTTGLPNAVTLSWTTGRETTASLSYGPDGDLADSLTVNTEASTSHSVTLFGLPALTDIAFSILEHHNSADSVCEGSFTTDNLPSGLPPFEITINEDDLRSPERYILGVAMADAHADTLFVIDRQGDWRWLHPGDADIQTTHVAFDKLSQDILFNGVDPQHAEDISAVYTVSQTGTLLDSRRTPLAHHLFYQHEDGTLAYPTADIRQWYDADQGHDVTVVGDALEELSPDGTIRTIWSAWDHLQVTKSEGWDRGFYANGRDWTHGNALDYDAATDSYLLSLGNITTIVQIDRSSGDTLDIVSPDTYTYLAGTTAFAFQHDAHWTEDGHLLLLSHGDAGSQPIEYEIDQAEKTLREVWSGPAVPSTSFLGQVRRLSNGNTLINYGGLGLLRELTPEGGIAWEAALGVGYWFGNVTAFDDFYTGQ